jgi:hypothetical protein
VATRQCHRNRKRNDKSPFIGSHVKTVIIYNNNNIIIMLPHIFYFSDSAVSHSLVAGIPTVTI